MSSDKYTILEALLFFIYMSVYIYHLIYTHIEIYEEIFNDVGSTSVHFKVQFKV